MGAITRYWTWRNEREELGGGPHIYERWGRWTFLVDLVLNQWAIGFGWEDYDGNRYWNIHLGPLVLSWSAPDRSTYAKEGDGGRDRA